MGHLLSLQRLFILGFCRETEPRRSLSLPSSLHLSIHLLEEVYYKELVPVIIEACGSVKLTPKINLTLNFYGVCSFLALVRWQCQKYDPL